MVFYVIPLLFLKKLFRLGSTSLTPLKYSVNIYADICNKKTTRFAFFYMHIKTEVRDKTGI